jgi:hypothetical protein
VTVERFRKQSRRGCLANAARAGKEISVVKSLICDRVLEGSGDWFLPGYFFESLRAPFASDYLICHSSFLIYEIEA